MKTSFLIPLFMLLVLCEIHGQNSLYITNLTEEDGLPGSEVYHVLQDRLGYIWFATSFGVSRFDGSDFQTFTTKDGLAGNSIIRMHEDVLGRIWFSSYSGYISYYQNGVFVSHPQNQEIVRHTKGYVDFASDEDGRVFFTSKYNTTIVMCIDPDLRFSYVSHKDTLRRGTYSLRPLANGLKWHLINPSSGSSSAPPYITKQGESLILHAPTKYHRDYIVNYTLGKNNEIYFSIGKCLLYIQDTNIVFDLPAPSPITNLYVDINNDLWVSTSNEGTLIYRNSDLSTLPDTLFKGILVSHITNDREGNFWVSTDGNGVYFVPALASQIHSVYNYPQSHKIISLKAFHDTLYILNINKGLYTYAPGSNGIERIDTRFEKKGMLKASDITLDNKQRLWALGTPSLVYDVNSGKRFEGPAPQAGVHITQLSDRRVAMLTFNNLRIYEADSLNCTSHILLPGIVPKCMYESLDGRIWIGSLQGLFCYSENHLENYGKRYPSLGMRITSFAENTSFLCIGTRGNGIHMLYQDSLYTIDKSDGIIGNNVLSLCFENDTSLWAGTNNGLVNIRFAKKHPGRYKIFNYTTWDGLPSNNINHIVLLKGKLYLATDRHLSYFDPQQLNKEVQRPLIRIQYIWVNDSLYTMQDSIVLPYSQNSIRIRFNGLHIKSIDHLSYTYQLKGLHKKPIRTTNRDVEMASLAPGSYVFEVFAYDINGRPSAEPAQIHIQITKPYWQSSLFYLGLVLVGMVFISGLILLIVRYMKRKSQREQLLISYRQQALSKQLKPHFLYNSLNSIQRFILENESQVASHYLSSFSRLMRIILEMSDKQFVTLDEEIRSLELYIKLEALRLNGNLDSRIDLPDSFDTNGIYVPTFIIQPFVENAIWHGLNNLSGKRCLVITFRLEGNYLKCSVEDNGIGREQAKLRKQAMMLEQKQQSYGIQITRSRLNLYNKRYASESYFQITDLQDENGQSSGTRIDIFLSHKSPKRNL